MWFSIFFFMLYLWQPWDLKLSRCPQCTHKDRHFIKCASRTHRERQMRSRRALKWQTEEWEPIGGTPWCQKGGAWTRFVSNWKQQVRMKFLHSFCLSLSSCSLVFSSTLSPLFWQSTCESTRRTCALRAAPIDCVGKACGEVRVICTRCCFVLEKSTHA